MPGTTCDNTSGTSRTRTKACSRTLSTYSHTDSDEHANALHARVASLFGDAQLNIASHRKLAVSLRKIQEACIQGDGLDGRKNANTTHSTERDFNEEFVTSILQILCVKRSEGVGDKTVRFVGLFLKHASDCGSSTVHMRGSIIMNLQIWLHVIRVHSLTQKNLPTPQLHDWGTMSYLS